MASKEQAAEEVGSSQTAPLSNSERLRKRDQIARACETADVDALINLADSTGGLLEDVLRQSAWPILLACGDDHLKRATTEDLNSWRKLPPHRDEEQVQRDVDRAFVYYPANETQKVIDGRKQKLFELIVCVLRQHPILCYFQGYHDIAQVFLLVLGEEEATRAVPVVSLTRIRDYMLPSLTPALKHLQLLPYLLEAADSELCRHLAPTQPFFALSATLTLYAHDIQEYSDIARLYDFILAHEPVTTIYLFAAIMISRRKELLDIPIDEPEMLHFTLSKLPQPLNLENLIAGALTLFRTHPPERLPHFVWWRLSSSSVLKTSRSIKQHQRLEDAEKLFQRQARELQLTELRGKAAKYVVKNQRRLLPITVAVIVGAFSIWLRRSGNDRHLLMSTLKLFEFWKSGR